MFKNVSPQRQNRKKILSDETLCENDRRQKKVFFSLRKSGLHSIFDRILEILLFFVKILIFEKLFYFLLKKNIFFFFSCYMRVPVNVFYIEDTVRLILSRRVAKLRTVEIFSVG